MIARDIRPCGCMDACSAIHALFTLVGFLLALSAVQGQSILFTQAPANLTYETSANFRFNLVGANGIDPCGQCSIQCKLDHAEFRSCLGREDSYVSLAEGLHNFTVAVNTSDGLHFSTLYIWTVDSIPPTASVYAGPIFTNAVNITVIISFTKKCDGNGGFQCSGPSSCDLQVHGAGTVIPQTLKEITPGLVYSVQVELSTVTPTGKVAIFMSSGFCKDAAGNTFQRSSNSRVLIRFARTIPTLYLWTAIPESNVQINSQARTVQATNNSTYLKIYLDFSDPVLATVEQLRSVLHVTSGTLVALQRKSRGNRRFGFQLNLNTTSAAVVTVILPGNTTVSKYGTPVAETSSVAFLYDIVRPQVQLSTTALAHTQDRILPIVIQFTKPVFLFGSSSVTISGGILRSFKEISKTTYALVLYAIDNNVISVAVADNQTLDVAGNSNIASSLLEVRHYTTPAVSVALFSFITASLLGTALASGALAVSTANLAAAGALSSRASASIGADPSRNLLGMAGHLQIFALSDFLAVSLPIDYGETTKGLRWLIPHVNTPWQINPDTNLTGFGNNVHQVHNQSNKGKRRLLMVDHDSSRYRDHHRRSSRIGRRFRAQRPIYTRGVRATAYRAHRSTNTYITFMRDINLLSNPVSKIESQRVHLERRRRLRYNATQFGPALLTSDYETYFLNQAAVLRRLKNELNASKYTGWEDFNRNVFWLAVVGGGLILLHIVSLLLLRWRTKTSLRGALSFPRFELFFLMLAIPAICQASGFVIRGGTVAGIVVGVLLLAIPASFLSSVTLFLFFAIFLGKLVQYKEIRPVPQRDGTSSPTLSSRCVAFLAGQGYEGKWVRKEGVAPTFVPRYGLLFKDRKGPPRLVKMIDDDAGRKFIGGNGLRRIQALKADNDNDEAPVSLLHKLLGYLQAAYILVDLSRRITLGVIFGLYPRSDKSWVQVSLVFAFTVGQFLYLVTLKPFRRRGVQLVESISLLCEIGMFATALALLARGHPTSYHFGVGIFMLVLLVVSFVAQSANEWFALTKQVLQLSTAEEISFEQGLREFSIGLLLPFIPRSKWSRFISPQSSPRTEKTPVVLDSTPVFVDTRPSTFRDQQDMPLETPSIESGILTVDKKFYDPTAPVLGQEIELVETRPNSGEFTSDGGSSAWRRQESLGRKKTKEEERIQRKVLHNLALASLDASPSGEEGSIPRVRSPIDGASSSGANKSRHWRGTLTGKNRIHSSEDLSEMFSDWDVTPDPSQELIYSVELGQPIPTKRV